MNQFHAHPQVPPDNQALPQPHVHHQPGATPGMTVAPRAPVLNTERPGKFSTGLCGCSFSGCCMSFWCPCFVYGSNKQRLESLNKTGHPLPKEQIESCDSNNIIYLAVACVTGLGCLLDMIQRSDTRTRYQIQGGGCGDFWRACCCGICSQQQVSRELGREEEALVNAPGGAGVYHQPGAVPPMSHAPVGGNEKPPGYGAPQ